MRNRDTLRVGGRRLARGNTDLAHTILSVTDNGGGFVRVTTAAPHGLALGAEVVVTGSNVSAYNQTHPVTAPDPADPVSLVFDTDIGFTAVGTGGYWKLA